MNLLHRINNVATRNIPVKLIRSRLGRPVASITFDDFPKSAWRAGGPILERHGARATYYAAGRFCGQTEDGIEYYDANDLVEVRDAGHEIGCHTFSHQYGTGVRSPLLDADTDRNQSFIGDHLGDYPLSSFAYPYGDVSPRTKLLFSSRFPTSRGIRRGVNSGLIDLAQLKAIGLEKKAWNPAAIERAVGQAARLNAWIIFFTHDISDDPSPFGATSAMLDHALGCVRAAGIDILPVKHALARAVFQ
ncbi:MAG TPA: polysaccharide deacetylase family protein [Caulobacteraceae bacterium]|jgi:peptidoglycan/xylan/chitin deacetylase (PgdA/CDA1 family)|nr:polysaccharide deacetylase family protein [Caulobacteraceae bacterium]